MSADSPRPDDAELDALVFEFLERAESAPAESSGVLSELCQRAPSHAAQLRQRVELLARSGLWGAPAERAGEFPERLGEFRLIRRLGGGGMGVVYLAEQSSVGRRVALKLIRSEQLFAQSTRARFVREARAIARLDHPSIVRVLTIGEEQGQPFLAMEYVPGAALDALLDRLGSRAPGSLSGADARAALVAELSAASEDSSSSENTESFARGWVEFAVRVARDIALALEHAHERGVLHRDVKPSNMLLSADGRVRLCDFGLAALSGGETLTRSGAQLGSLPYMAPEQLRGDVQVVGPATDVYGLGVTLYELVTLTRPFRGQSEEAVRSSILESRPQPMRQLNASSSADIETVCAKAMDFDPRRRYASAADFARDLSNVLELRPIEARPPGHWTRARRLTQRRPAAAVAVVAGALLLVAGPLGWELNRMRTMEEVSIAYASERAAREQSERDFRAALQAVGHVLRGLAVDDLRDAPRMQRVRLAAIERAQALFDALERDRGADPQLLSEGAELYASRADVLYDMGQYDEAIESDVRALALLERMAVADPSSDVRTRTALVLGDQAKSLQAQGRWRESLVVFERVEGITRELAGAADASLEQRRMLAITLANVAEARQTLGDLTLARARLEEAATWVDPLIESAPDSAPVAWAYGRVHGDLGDLQRKEGDALGSLGPMERRRRAFRRACELAPGQRYYRFDAASAAISLAGALAEQHEPDEAERLLLEARTELDALLDEFPEAERYVRERWRVDQTLGSFYGGLGRVADAIEIFRTSAERIDRSAREMPDRVDIALFAAQAKYNLAVASVHSGAPLAEIEEALDDVNRRIDEVLARESGYTLAESMRVMTLYNRALARCLRNELDGAESAVRAFDAGGGEDAGGLRYRADLFNELVLASRRAAGHDAARLAREQEWTEAMFARLEAAVAAGYRDVYELESTPALASFRDDERFARIRAACARATQ